MLRVFLTRRCRGLRRLSGLRCLVRRALRTLRRFARLLPGGGRAFVRRALGLCEEGSADP